jgi:hypothetical protein
MVDLDRRFGSLDRLDAPDVTAEIERRSRIPGEPQGERMSRRLVAGVVAFALFAAAAVFALSLWRSGPDRHVTRTPSPRPDAAIFPGVGDGLTELSPPPRLLVSAVTVWTGRDLILWGGNERFGDPPHFNEGYAFDAATLTWRTLPPSPLSGRSWSAGAWTGREVVIWGGATGHSSDDGMRGDGAAYDPAADSWRTIAQAPIDPTPVIGAVWTGNEMIVVGEDASAAYDPASDTWRTVADPPVRLNEAHVVWTGREVILFGAFLAGVGRFTTETAIGAAYDPAADAWREIAPSELEPNAQTAAWDGSRLVAVDYGLAAAAYDPSSDAWMNLPRMPFNACEGGPAAASVSGIVMAQNCGEVGTLSAGDERWHVVFGRDEPAFGFYAEPIASGPVFLLLGLRIDSDRAQMLAYRPPHAIPVVRRAWDVAAAVGALRSHYPYEEGKVPPEIEAELRTLVSPDAYAVWQDPSSGLGKLWTYNTGFVVRSVERTDTGSVAVIRFTTYSGTDPFYDEALTIAPGAGMDGSLHDLVVVDVAPA